MNTLGWALIILGVIQLTGGLSLLAGNTYGRVIGIIGGSLGAIGALLLVGGSYPWGRVAGSVKLRIGGALAAAGLPRQLGLGTEIRLTLRHRRIGMNPGYAGSSARHPQIRVPVPR